MSDIEKPKPLSPAQRRARTDAKKRAAGLIPVLVWVPKQHKQALLDLAKKLTGMAYSSHT